MKYYFGRTSLLFILLAIIPFLLSCDSKNIVKSDSGNRDNQKNIYINTDLLKRDLIYFIDKFRVNGFKHNFVTWNPKFNSFQLYRKQYVELAPFMIAEKRELPMDRMSSDFYHSYYYLDQVWLNKKFSNIAIPKDVMAFIKDFLQEKYKLDSLDRERSILALRTYSSLLRLIDLVDRLPSELTSKFGNMPLPKVKSILTKTAYDEVRKRFFELQNQSEGQADPILECRNYWPIAPIMKLDEAYTRELIRLEELTKKIHVLLDSPDKSLAGHLSDHLLCVESIEEAIGRYPEANTGEGILDRYIEYIASNLWDYPYYGRQCGPFRGVMGNFTRTEDGRVNFCKENFKSVADNMHLSYLLKRFGVRRDLPFSERTLKSDGFSVGIMRQREELFVPPIEKPQ